MFPINRYYCRSSKDPLVCTRVGTTKVVLSSFLYHWLDIPDGVPLLLQLPLVFFSNSFAISNHQFMDFLLTFAPRNTSSASVVRMHFRTSMDHEQQNAYHGILRWSSTLYMAALGVCVRPVWNKRCNGRQSK
jgi:hypothetical protein